MSPNWHLSNYFGYKGIFSLLKSSVRIWWFYFEFEFGLKNLNLNFSSIWIFTLKRAKITHWFWRGENTKHLHFKNKRISFRSNCCKMRLFVDFSKTMANQGKECRKWMISAATHVMFHTPRKWFKRGQKVELLKECCTVKQIGNFISDLRSNGVARYHFFFFYSSLSGPARCENVCSPPQLQNTHQIKYVWLWIFIKRNKSNCLAASSAGLPRLIGNHEPFLAASTQRVVVKHIWMVYAIHVG